MKQSQRPSASKRLSNIRRRPRNGIAAVEMAFVAPFVFLLVFGAVEFARIMMVRQALTNAAREGCRHACLVNTPHFEDAEQVMRDALRGVIAETEDTELLRVTLDPSFQTTLDPGTTITAAIEVDCADISWIPPMFFSGAVIRGSAAMKRE